MSSEVPPTSSSAAGRSEGHSTSSYTSVADPHRHRQPDAELFSCFTHGKAAVLCLTAGKTGRNRKQATVGATVFWCTCPALNNLIARLESANGVLVVNKFLDARPEVAAVHCDSHAIFESRVRHLLVRESPELWDFYETHFIKGSSSSIDSGNDPKVTRKYGNAAVSNPKDVKCFHALVGQELCGASNPLGVAICNYIILLYHLMKAYTSSEDVYAVEPPPNEGGEERSPRVLSTAKIWQRMVDSPVLLTTFLEVVLGNGGPLDSGTPIFFSLQLSKAIGEAENERDQGASVVPFSISISRTPKSAAEVPKGCITSSFEWCVAESLQYLSNPDLCTMATFVISTLKGKARIPKKRRIN